MTIVDRLLERRAQAGRPVRVGMLGAGFMGQGIANSMVNSTPGMDLVAICNRHPERARQAYKYAGIDDAVTLDSPQALDDAAMAGRCGVTDDPAVLTRAETLDAIVEVTGTIDHAAAAIIEAFDHGKHVVLMNAEVDGTVGPYLKVLADRAGVVYTASEGDQPGVEGNLVRFVRSLGLEPLVAGNIKGLQDEYRNPTTQQGFADQWGQNVNMVTSFADGTKISFEQAIVANAFGLTVPRRGMNGYDWDGHVDDAVSLYDIDRLREVGGTVDYLVRAKPGPGVFVYAACDDPKQRHYLNLYKLGEGPLYSFYTPYHLCHFEVANSVARAVLAGDAVLAPHGAPRVEVVTAAKTDLDAGAVLDRMGGYHTYGVAERADLAAEEQLLPMGVAEGCRLLRRVARDDVLTYRDVVLPEDRLVDRLRADQAAHFARANRAP